MSEIFGGHGNLDKMTGAFEQPYDEGRCRDADLKKVWDYQYASLLICNGGGGTFKDMMVSNSICFSGCSDSEY